MITKTHPDARLSWSQSGGGWAAFLHLPAGSMADATAVAGAVFAELENLKANHPILDWERFVSKTFTSERAFIASSATACLEDSSRDEAFTPLFTAQIPAQQNEALEHFDSPFRAARRDYFPDNLRSVIANTERDHLIRTIAAPWDYADAMANQSLRLDHGDDRRHAYQWHAPTADPARQKTGCMLGANRLAMEAFPLFPCIPVSTGNTAIGFICKSKTWTWISWPVWAAPCSLSMISSLLNLASLHESEPDLSRLRRMGILAVFRSRRLPVEKNKVFLPPVSLGS
ncbi:MAG: hypothetical protein ABI680_00750 [Chthoniobacteraceae bacterium]